MPENNEADRGASQAGRSLISRIFGTITSPVACRSGLRQRRCIGITCMLASRFLKLGRGPRPLPYRFVLFTGSRMMNLRTSSWMPAVSPAQQLCGMEVYDIPSAYSKAWRPLPYRYRTTSRTPRPHRPNVCPVDNSGSGHLFPVNSDNARNS